MYDYVFNEEEMKKEEKKDEEKKHFHLFDCQVRTGCGF